MRRARFGWVALAATAAFGCQAILGIDDTTFHDSNGDGDAAPADGATPDGGPIVDSGGDSASEDGGGTALLTFTPSMLLVHRGESVDVGVTVARSGYTGPIAIALASVGDAGAVDGGANGVSMAPVSIAPSTSSGTTTLHLAASATATLGVEPLAFVVTTSSTATFDASILVAGTPGTLDTTFGTGGIVADYPTGAGANGVSCGDDGKIYVIGDGSPWVIRRYDENGATDSAFDTAVAGFGGGGGTGSKIIAHGSSIFAGGGDGSNQITIKKLTTAGGIDATFGSSGTYYFKQSSNSASGTINGLVLTPTGDLLASTQITSPGVESRSWRIRGTTVAYVSYGSTVDVGGVAFDPSGNAVVGGVYQTADAGTVLWTQKLDDAFADAGTASTGTKPQYLSEGAVAVSSDRIGVFGGYNGGAGHSLAVFDLASLAIVSAAHGVDHTGTFDAPFAAATTQADGRMLGVGTNGGSTSEFAYVTRFESDAGEDKTFGSNGTFDAPGNASIRIEFHDVTVDSWGRIVAVGSDSALGWYIVRLWP